MINILKSKLSWVRVLAFLFVLIALSTYLHAEDPPPTKQAEGPELDFGSFAERAAPPTLFEPSPLSSKRANGARSAPATGSLLQTGSPTQYLTAARKAFWGGAYAQAIQYYRQLIQAMPNDPEPFGELGDTYHFQGRNDLAAQAYYDAGLRYNWLNRPKEAWQMVRLIRPLDTRRADALVQEFTRISP